MGALWGTAEMIFQPAIIALLLASAVNVVMLLGIAPFAVDVIRHWDIASGSERQLTLERRTYLMSALLFSSWPLSYWPCCCSFSTLARWQPCLSVPCVR